MESWGADRTAIIRTTVAAGMVIRIMIRADVAGGMGLIDVRTDHIGGNALGNGITMALLITIVVTSISRRYSALVMSLSVVGNVMRKLVP